MKPLIVTNAAGQKVRLNPMNVVGWVPSKVDLGDGSFQAGTTVAMVDGARPIRESVEQFDWMFELATDGWMRPPVTRRDLEGLIDQLRARDDEAPATGVDPVAEDGEP